MSTPVLRGEKVGHISAIKATASACRFFHKLTDGTLLIGSKLHLSSYIVVRVTHFPTSEHTNFQVPTYLHSLNRPMTRQQRRDCYSSAVIELRASKCKPGQPK